MTRPRRTLTSSITAALALVPVAGVTPAEGVQGSRGFERDLRRCVADERARAGAPALHSSTVLHRAARSHARSMARRGYVSHTDPRGRSASQRVHVRAPRFVRVGEAIAAGQRTARQVCRDWMASPSHRSIVLSREVTALGAGAATGRRHGRYAVLVVGSTRR